MLLIAVGLLAGPPHARLAGDNAPATGDGQNERAVEMKRIVESLSVVRGEGAERRPVPLRSEPLFRWNDPTRKFSDASLWAWGETGRPEALLALELYPHSESVADLIVSWGSWAFELISLDRRANRSHRRAARRNCRFERAELGQHRLHPLEAGETRHDLPTDPRCPVPAVSASRRQAQMKELIKRFSADEAAAEEGRE